MHLLIILCSFRSGAKAVVFAMSDFDDSGLLPDMVVGAHGFLQVVKVHCFGLQSLE